MRTTRGISELTPGKSYKEFLKNTKIQNSGILEGTTEESLKEFYKLIVEEILKSIEGSSEGFPKYCKIS